MNYVKAAYRALLVCGLALAGCGDDGATPTDGGGGRDSGGGPVDSGPAMDYFYVIDSLRVGREDPPSSGVAPGFDLDGRVSDDMDEAGCFIPDYTSPQGQMGIDNQLAALIPTLEGALGGNLDDQIAGAIADGDLTVLLSLQDINSFEADSDATLELLLGHTPGTVVCAGAATCMDGAMPYCCPADTNMDGTDDTAGACVTEAGGTPMPFCSGKPMLSGMAIASGQTFNVDSRSLGAGGMAMINEPLTIAGSVATVMADNIALSVPFDPDMPPVTLNIRNARVEFRASQGGLMQGIIGGQLNIDELIAIALMLMPTLPEMLIRSTLMSSADLEMGPDGCEAISVALLFTATQATRGDVVMPVP